MRVFTVKTMCRTPKKNADDMRRSGPLSFGAIAPTALKACTSLRPCTAR
jgi:hypothetical protein